MYMKLAQIVGFAALGGWVGTMVCGAIEPGDSIEDMKQELGEPMGFIDAAGSQTYIYDRGKVTAENGKVTTANLISVEALEAKRETEALERELQAEALRQQRARRYQEGSEVLASRLDDPAFMNLPASQRVSYWKSFRVKYPEVTLPADYELALREQEAEMRTRRAEQRIQDLENETRRAEQEAAIAAREAQEAATRNSYYRSGYYGYPSVVYTGTSRCTCHHHTRRACSVHHPRTYKSTYTPYHSTPGYGYQRPLSTGTSRTTISSRPFSVTGSAGAVPKTRGQVNRR